MSGQDTWSVDSAYVWSPCSDVADRGKRGRCQVVSSALFWWEILRAVSRCERGLKSMKI